VAVADAVAAGGIGTLKGLSGTHAIAGDRAPVTTSLLPQQEACNVRECVQALVL
jgi:hypothetical protein